MTWPTTPIDTTAMDGGSDLPPRSTFHTWADAFNSLIAHVSTLWQGILTATTVADILAALDLQNRNVAHPVFSATPTFDCSLYSYFYPGVMTANITSMTLSNVEEGKEYVVRLKQDATGGRSSVFPTGAKISGAIGVLPNQVTLIGFIYITADARLEGSCVVLPV